MNLTAVGTEQTIIKDYLEQNASEALADKINNGVRIVKDGKTLINKKTLDTFMQYACEEAHKLAEKGARSACIGQDTVFGWAVHYFEENDIIGTFYNEDGTEYKPPKPVVNKTAPKPVSPPKPKPQQSLFDLIDMQAAPKAEAETVTDEEPEPDKLDEESCGIEPDEQCETENTDAENSDAEDEQDDEPDIPKGLHQISETEWADEDGVIYETTEVTKPAVPEAFIKLFGGAVVAR